MHLDSLPLLKSETGYGNVGLHGALGYEGKTVSVHRCLYSHAISAHPPARLLYPLNGRFTRFTAQVAMNDDVPVGASHADFSVLVDGREIAVEPYVRPGEPPRAIVADVTGGGVEKGSGFTLHLLYTTTLPRRRLIEVRGANFVEHGVFGTKRPTSIHCSAFLEWGLWDKSNLKAPLCGLRVTFLCKAF